MNNCKKFRVGPTAMKILLLLNGGLVLGLNRRSDKSLRIIKDIAREWREIDREALYSAIRKLYESKLVKYQKNKDGTIRMVLDDGGKEKILQYDFKKMQIKKGNSWDGLWRMIIFDIPEIFKKRRDALSAKLKELGFYSMQKSVFIYPYECKDELDFVIEVLKLRKFVRFLMVRETDIDPVLKRHFEL